MRQYSRSYLLILSLAVILLIGSQVAIVHKLLLREKREINYKVWEAYKNYRPYPFMKIVERYNQIADRQVASNNFETEKIIKELKLPSSFVNNTFKDSVAKIGVTSKINYAQFVQSYQLKTKNGWKDVIPSIQNPIIKERLIYGNWSEGFNSSQKNFTIANSNQGIYTIEGRNYRILLTIVYDVGNINNLAWKNIFSIIILILISTSVLCWAIYSTLNTIRKEKEISLVKMRLLQQLAHEFKTPLAVTKMATRMLKNNHDVNLLTTINQQQKKLDDLTDNILYRVDHFKEEMNYNEEINLSNQTQRIIENMRIKYPDKHINLETTFNPDQIYSNKRLIILSLENLIDNAIKYSEHNVQIHCSSKIEDDILEISIKDQGIGISKNDMQKIGTSYFRAEKAIQHHSKGFGLGLHILIQELKTIGAKLSWQSMPNNFTEFKISIPQ